MSFLWQFTFPLRTSPKINNGLTFLGLFRFFFLVHVNLYHSVPPASYDRLVCVGISNIGDLSLLLIVAIKLVYHDSAEQIEDPKIMRPLGYLSLPRWSPTMSLRCSLSNSMHVISLSKIFLRTLTGFPSFAFQILMLLSPAM